MSRETDGACKCRDNYDGHEYLLYHTGGGKMVDYVTLQSCVLSMVNGGTTQYAFHKTIKDNCESLGNRFSCNYQTFLEASDGFVNNLEFDLQTCFSCMNCGISPKYFVGDGKADNGNYQQELFELNSQLPVLWPQMVNICIFMATGAIIDPGLRDISLIDTKNP